VEDGGWRVEGGGWRVEGGRWRVEGGGRRVEGGRGWRAESGGGWRRVEEERKTIRAVFLCFATFNLSNTENLLAKSI
jgi:hypothetical protein